jgi:hypothetical protein
VSLKYTARVGGVGPTNQLVHKGQIQHAVQIAGEVVGGDEFVERAD